MKGLVLKQECDEPPRGGLLLNRCRNYLPEAGERRIFALDHVPLFSKDQLAGLVGHLQRRNVLLRHACQLKDFESYLKLGGVPSRKTLTGANLPFTEFQTDRRDLVNNVWDKVFFNFSDLGQNFAGGGPWTPNPYGPIVLKFDPSVL